MIHVYTLVYFFFEEKTLPIKGPNWLYSTAQQAPNPAVLQKKNYSKKEKHPTQPATSSTPLTGSHPLPSLPSPPQPATSPTTGAAPSHPFPSTHPTAIRCELVEASSSPTAAPSHPLPSHSRDPGLPHHHRRVSWTRSSARPAWPPRG